jgi:hypothetical protein
MTQGENFSLQVSTHSERSSGEITTTKTGPASSLYPFFYAYRGIRHTLKYSLSRHRNDSLGQIWDKYFGRLKPLLKSTA